MILTALTRYYDRVAGTPDAPPPFGYAECKVDGAIQIDGTGRFHGILDLRETNAKGKPMARRLVVPLPPRRTAGIDPGFLCDNSGYLCGHDAKGKPERAAEQFAAAARLHHDLLDAVDHPAARAILSYFDTWPVTEAEAALAPYADFQAGWLVFRLIDLDGDTRLAHDIPVLRAAWADHIAAANPERIGQCLVTGATDVPIAKLHGVIKGVRDAQSSGAALVSFNIGSATSFGQEQSFNAPVSESAAFAYVTALNHLLRPNGQSRTIGDTALVYWAERVSAAESLIADLFDPPTPGADATEDDIAAARRVEDILDRLVQGLPADDQTLSDPTVRFHFLGLSPNAARLSVRLWAVESLADLLDRARDHHRDLALVTDFLDRPAHPPLWRLVSELRPKDKDGKARGKSSGDALKKLCGDLLRAALTGGAYPESLLPLLLDRFRSDRWVNHPRVSLLKAALNRRARLSCSTTEDLPMSLDETRTEVGYRLGRLFAVLERLQATALGDDINAGLRDKFIAAASATPMTVFPYLLRLSQAHLKKARRKNSKRAKDLDNLAFSIADETTDIPAVLSPRDQGLFFLGYYQQQQAFYSGRKTADAEQTPA